MSVVIYEPGDVIQSINEPYVKALLASSKKIVCDQCFMFGTSLQKCGGCSQMHYCCITCQKKDWKNGHKLECKSNTFKNFIDSDLKRQLFRVMAFNVINPKAGDIQYALYNGESISFNELMSKQIKWTPNSDLQGACDDLAWQIMREELDTGDIKVDTDYFLKLLGILQTSVFAIFADETIAGTTGVGIYVELSGFTHSCKPKAILSPRGMRIEVRTIESIGKGETPTITLIGGNMNKLERQKTLKSRYNFDCHCVLCDGNLDSNVDFKKLDILINSLMRCGLDPNLAMVYTYDRLFAKHEEILVMMKQMYFEYDERISNQYSRALAAVANINTHFKNSYIPIFKKLINDARNHSQITFGVEHPDYQQFEIGIAEKEKQIEGKKIKKKFIY